MSDTPLPGYRGGRRRSVIMLGTLVLLGIGLTAGIITGRIPNPFQHVSPTVNAASVGDTTPTVKTIRPKRESEVHITVDQLATVEAYYQAEMRARASGFVRRVHFDIGDKVRKGELLVEIDVPESDQDVGKFEAMILQRQQELKVSRAKWKDSLAAKDVSSATIKQRDAEVQGAIATRDLKQRRFDRFKELAAKGSIVGTLVDEEERDLLSSEAVVTSAKANVERARADYSESESKVEAAAADIELKAAQIEVARKDLDRAKVVANYGRILAPFDGVVVRRTIDPGSFVQNSTTGVSEPLITVARVDIVTVSAKLPDGVSPFVTRNTPAIVEVDDLPGVNISASVTRFAPSVATSDRTMRVEVDLFNGDETEYQYLQSAIMNRSADCPTKSPQDPLPVRAFPPGTTTARLMPGMTGTLKLTLGGYGVSYVLPSTAVYSRGGATYLMVVENGKTLQLPVKVQLNDGKTVRLAIYTKRKQADGTTRDVLSELTGNEEIVSARQMEFPDGTRVTTCPSEW